MLNTTFKQTSQSIDDFDKVPLYKPGIFTILHTSTDYGGGKEKLKALGMKIPTESGPTIFYFSNPEKCIEDSYGSFGWDKRKVFYLYDPVDELTLEWKK